MNFIANGNTTYEFVLCFSLVFFADIYTPVSSNLYLMLCIFVSYTLILYTMFL